MQRWKKGLAVTVSAFTLSAGATAWAVNGRQSPSAAGRVREAHRGEARDAISRDVLDVRGRELEARNENEREAEAEDEANEQERDADAANDHSGPSANSGPSDRQGSDDGHQDRDHEDAQDQADNA
jgi:hypothetical protein